MPKTVGKSAKRKMEVVKEEESTASQAHDPDEEEALEKYIPPINKIIE